MDYEDEGKKKEEEGQVEREGEGEGSRGEAGEGEAEGEADLLEIEVGDLVQNKQNEKQIWLVQQIIQQGEDEIVEAGPDCVRKKRSEWTLLKKADEVCITPHQMLCIFKIFDGNHDGKLSKDEFRKVLQELDPDAWTEERLDGLDSCWEYWDANGDGTIDYREFLSWAFAPKCDISDGVGQVWEHAEDLYSPTTDESNCLYGLRADLLKALGDEKLALLYESGFDLVDWGPVVEWGMPRSRVYDFHVVKAAEYYFEYKHITPKMTVAACVGALLEARWVKWLCVCRRRTCIAYERGESATACIRYVRALEKAEEILTPEFVEKVNGTFERKELVFQKYGRVRPGMKKWWEKKDKLLHARRRRQQEAINRDPGGEKNLALASKGAFVVSAEAQGNTTLLIAIDELRIGPDLDAWCHKQGGEPIYMNPARFDAGWSGHSHITLNQKYWTGHPCPEIILNLGQRARLKKLGFMDREWDDQFMPRVFRCYIKDAEEDDWQFFGEGGIPGGKQHGDPLWNRLRNLWIIGAEDPPAASLVKFSFPDANGKRILHLFALGEPIAAMAMTVKATEMSDDQALFNCTNMAGEEVNFYLARDTKFADLKEAVASNFDGKPLDFRLLQSNGELLAHPDYKVLTEVFGMSPTKQQLAAQEERERREAAAAEDRAALHRLRFAMKEVEESPDI